MIYQIKSLSVIKDIVNLKHLVYKSNNLEILPEEIYHLKNLQSLDVSDNKLTKVPIIKSSSFNSLFMENNDLKDFSSVSEMENLKILEYQS